ncbi:lactonase family protein [Streptomyces zagrosensis]|uniref:6-phosphogluconolactonase (Cycloisomerase 2 family) n=1 Tax=Streptomyces zagrosensis TaxID=1042984 RepID=A0A7W9V1P4_9ACTN|nr:lactonase family protein [Streptomyces zagrosensis]MBB5938461.1 6-phosphogluconolactonase (cycloisomerase 2 family) [Streptomyces zagrosensis]
MVSGTGDDSDASKAGDGAAPNGQRAYIGSFTSAGGWGVSVAAVDPTSGALTIKHSTDIVENPSYLALAPGRDVLYAVSETADGYAAAFSLNDPDQPTPLGVPALVGGDDPTHLSLTAGHLLTANYSSGSVSVLPYLLDPEQHIAPCGLAQPTDVRRHEGSGPDPQRQQGPHAHTVLPDPSGRWVLAVDLGTDTVYSYELDDEKGTLRPHGAARLTAGAGPRQLAFHPGGEWAYVTNELDSTVTICRWNATTGELTPTDTISVLPADAGSPQRSNYPSELVIAADGRYAWVANRGHDSLAVLNVSAAGDQLTLSTTVDCGGHWPRHLTLAPTGERLYVANERSGDVAWFDIDAPTGVPAWAGSVDAPAASCVVFA